MLTIRMQRTGRHGHAQFRVVVQDSRFHPSSGRVVAHLGSYDPHTKATTLNTEKASSYLANGAQPSERVAKLLQREGVDLPKWVKLPAQKTRATRNPGKLRSNTEPTEEPEAAPAEPAEEPAEIPEEAPTAEETPAAETPEEPASEEAPVAAEETSEPKADNQENEAPEKSKA